MVSFFICRCVVVNVGQVVQNISPRGMTLGREQNLAGDYNDEIAQCHIHGVVVRSQKMFTIAVLINVSRINLQQKMLKLYLEWKFRNTSYLHTSAKQRNLTEAH